MDLNRVDPNDQPAPPAPPAQPAGHRQSLLVTSGRRLTTLFRNNLQPPVADPSNSAEVNAQRKKEYDTIRNLNEAMEAIIDNFEQNSSNIQARSLFSSLLSLPFCPS
ncbi:hypothetical protein BX666DRAFT_1855161 [Dichotomocladium elegans]|nr:hypothetical protein BX666DRAFT_1855161 [Dichotomocladium elegans]